MNVERKKGMKSRLVTGLRHVNYLESMQIYLLNSSASALFILLLFAPPELAFVWLDFDFIVGRCRMRYRCMSAGCRILAFFLLLLLSPTRFYLFSSSFQPAAMRHIRQEICIKEMLKKSNKETIYNISNSHKTR